MATYKQTKTILRQIETHARALSNLMTKAHTMKIIEYDVYLDESPCATHYKTRERIVKTTAKALAKVAREEMLQGLPW